MIQIPLTKGKFALIDDEMFDRVSYFKWYAHEVISNQGTIYYAASRSVYGNRIFVLMHQLIMGMPISAIDHKNLNGLDNQRSNIRLATKGQNSMNKPKKLNTSSNYKGVSSCKGRFAWQSGIKINKKRIALGRYNSEIDAAIAYNNAAILYFGEFARLNVIE